MKNTEVPSQDSGHGPREARRAAGQGALRRAGGAAREEAATLAGVQDALPVLHRFSQVGDARAYAPLPDDWLVGLSDVVDSTKAIAAGRYKAVNLAGAATIGAVLNALSGDLRLFVFGGDGARLVVPPGQGEPMADALSRVAMWARRDLGLDLRVGMVPIGTIRKAGHDVRAAFWQASEDLGYAMFTGGGLEWAEAELKRGGFALPPATEDREPDLTGLSCQWGAIRPSSGKIISLIVKAGPKADAESFAECVTQTVGLLESAARINPLPPEGPPVRWPRESLDLQARIARGRRPLWLRRLGGLAGAALAWVLFTLRVPLGGFKPDRYRRQVASNSDFRKFDDGLMMTLDCPSPVIEALRAQLRDAAAKGVVRFGLHVQDEALITCFVPSLRAADHVHFLDGGGGGYAAAAKQISA